MNSKILSHLLIVVFIAIASYDAQAVRYARGINARSDFKLSGNLTNLSVGKIYTLKSTHSSAQGIVQCDYTGEGGTSEEKSPFQYYRPTYGISLGNGWRSLNEYLSYKIIGPDGTPSDVWSHNRFASTCNSRDGQSTQNISMFSAAYPVTVEIRVDKIPATGQILVPVVRLGYYSRAHTSSPGLLPPVNPPNYSTFDIMLNGGSVIPETNCSITPAHLDIRLDGSANQRLENTTTLSMKCNNESRIKIAVRNTAEEAASGDYSLVALKSGTSTENARVNLHHNSQTGKEITVDFRRNISENIAVNTVLDKFPSGQYQGATVIIATVE